MGYQQEVWEGETGAGEGLGGGCGEEGAGCEGFCFEFGLEEVLLGVGEGGDVHGWLLGWVLVVVGIICGLWLSWCWC